jgi:hypothetical protein
MMMMMMNLLLTLPSTGASLTKTASFELLSVPFRRSAWPVEA